MSFIKIEKYLVTASKHYLEPLQIYYFTNLNLTYSLQITVSPLMFFRGMIIPPHPQINFTKTWAETPFPLSRYETEDRVPKLTWY